MDDKVYTALGLMSGTSLDGIDGAIIKTDGVNIFDIWPHEDDLCLNFENVKVNVDLAKEIQAVVAWGFQGPSPSNLLQLEAEIDRLHLLVLQRQKVQWTNDWLPEHPPEDQSFVDLIGYHGLTVLHRPPLDGQPGRTLQLGRGQVLADRLGVPVAYDFRTADVAVNGQGAPLAPIYHEALVRYSDISGCVAVANIGGVSNVTLIEDGELKWATDCGPGNGPLDQWVQALTELQYDREGKLSWAGQVNHQIINQWFELSFFNRPIPRSADRYDFDVFADIADLSVVDGAATLASFCAQSIARDLQVQDVDTVIVCGGGRKNPAIMAMLDMHSDAEVVTAEHIGWDGDMLEAQAFAYLAVRTLKGLPISFPQTTGAPRPLTGGRVVYPSSNLGSRGGE